MSDELSDTHLIANLKDNEDVSVAQQEIWKRYFRRLCGLARKKMAVVRRAGSDEEDVALSALCCFFEGLPQGRFPELNDGKALWPLLARIATRRAINRYKHETAEIRGGGRVLGESAIGQRRDDLTAAGIAGYAEGGLTPEFADEMFLLVRDQLDLLQDAELRLIAIERLKGSTTTEIAQRLGHSKRYVERKLARIRTKWIDDERT